MGSPLVVGWLGPMGGILRRTVHTGGVRLILIILLLQRTVRVQQPVRSQVCTLYAAFLLGPSVQVKHHSYMTYDGVHDSTLRSGR